MDLKVEGGWVGIHIWEWLLVDGVDVLWILKCLHRLHWERRGANQHISAACCFKRGLDRAIGCRKTGAHLVKCGVGH
jgi:hypothetical protein